MSTLSMRIRAARTGLGLTQQALAAESGLHVQTIKKLEAGEEATLGTLMACQRAFEARGMEFFEIAGRHGFFLAPDHPAPDAARIRAARAALTVTGRDLAMRAGIAERSVVRVENGEPDVTADIIRACLRALQELGADLFELDRKKGLMLPVERSDSVAGG